MRRQPIKQPRSLSYKTLFIGSTKYPSNHHHLIMQFHHAIDNLNQIYLFVRSRSMKYINQLLLLVLSLSLLHSQQQPKLTLNKVQAFSLSSGQQRSYTLQIPTEQISANQDLYIIAESILNDITQTPTLLIQQSHGNYTLICDQNNNEFSGVCMIPSQKLVDLMSTPNDKSNNQYIFNITIACVESCSLKLEAYINDVIKTKIGDILTLTPKMDIETIFQFEFQVSATLQFTQLVIYLGGDNFRKQNKGIQMYANVGNSGAIVPSSAHYQYKAIILQRNTSLGIVISNTEIPTGSWVKVSIITPSQSESPSNFILKFSTYTLNTNQRSITLEDKIYDFTSTNEEKIYILNLTNKQNLTTNQDLNIIVSLYTGSPEISVSFHSNFSSSIQNLYITGNLNYLINEKIRQQKGYTGVVYIKVSSQLLAYFYLKCYINSKQYIKMDEDVTYIDYVESAGLRNYIYDYYYDTTKQIHSTKQIHTTNASQPIILNFTTKIEMIYGVGLFANRVCQPTSHFDNSTECILTNLSQLNDQKVMQQFIDLKAKIIKYYNLYEIYYSINVEKQCKMYSYTGVLWRYLCKIHMIGYNQKSNQDLAWGITTFARSNAILLHQGTAFKDMVEKNVYNYYTFYAPQLSSLREITFFITQITGSCTLISSLKEEYPEFIDVLEQNNDIKIATGSKITYNQSELTKNYNNSNFILPLYLGVYGDLCEYTINTVVKRTNSNDIITTSVIQLYEDISQQFTINKNSTLLEYKIITKDNTSYNLEIVEIEGDISFTIQHRTKQSNMSKLTVVQCINKNIGNQKKCTFNSKTNNQYKITVKREDSGKVQQNALFLISYYKQNNSSSNCRHYPMNYPAFLKIKAQSSECLQYSLTTLQDIQVSIAISNGMGSLKVINASIMINDKIFNKKINSHHQVITIEQLNTFCHDGNSDNQNGSNVWNSNIGCTLSLIIYNQEDNHNSNQEANNNSNKEANNNQYSVLLRTASTPSTLFDSIQETIISSDLSTDNGKYFNYKVVSTQANINIHLSSTTMNQYFIMVTLVEEQAYLQQIFSNTNTNTNSKSQKIKASYPKYPASNAKDINNNKIIQSQITRSNTRINIKITKTAFEQKFNCKECLVLIAIYPKDISSITTHILSIQVSQLEGSLGVSETKNGYLSKDEVYRYQIVADPKKDLLLRVRSTNANNNDKKQCKIIAKIYSDVNSQNNNSNNSSNNSSNSSNISEQIEVQQNKYSSTIAIIDEQQRIIWNSPTPSIYKLQLESSSQSHELVCSYQISLQYLHQEITMLQSEMTYSVKLQNHSSIHYYLYQHEVNTSFKIYTIMRTGHAKVYATPYTSISNIDDIITNTNIHDYKFVDESMDSTWLIQTSNQFYCSNCVYLIAVTNFQTNGLSSSFQGQIGISYSQQPITVAVNGAIRDRIIHPKGNVMKKTTIKNQYVYYEQNDFQLSFNIYYGYLQITIIDPNSQEIIKQSTTTYPNNAKSKIYSIASPLNTDSDFYDRKHYRYVIVIEEEQGVDAGYMLSFISSNQSITIIQGYALDFSCQAGQTNSTSFSFLNGKSISKKQNLTVLLIVNDDNIKQQIQIKLESKVHKYISKSQSFSEYSVAIVQQIHSSNNQYIYVIQSLQGNYLMKVSCNKSFHGKILISKGYITNINHNFDGLITMDRVFEVFNPNSVESFIVEVFNCRDNVQVKASSSLAAINHAINQNTNQQPQIILEHSNVAGHFVITAQNYQGQYFLKIYHQNYNNKSHILYRLIYKNTQSFSPYQYLSLSSLDIEYSTNFTHMTFSLKQVQCSIGSLKSQSNQVKIIDKNVIQISYQIIAASNRDTAHSASQCQIGDYIILDKSVSQNTCEQSTNHHLVELTHEDIKKTLQKISKEFGVYYLSATAKVTFKSNNKKYQAYYVYDIIEVPMVMQSVTSDALPEATTSSGIRNIILWIIIPLLLVVALVYVAFKFCWKKYKLSRDPYFGLEEEAQSKTEMHQKTQDQHKIKAESLEGFVKT